MLPAAGQTPERPRDGSAAALTWSDGWVRLRQPALFAAGAPAGPVRDFLGRVLGLEMVRSVEVDRAEGAATIRYDKAGVPASLAIERLGEALRRSSPGATPLRIGADIPPAPGIPRYRVFRRGATLTTWMVLDETPGRVLLGHDRLGVDADLDREVEDKLHTVDGVLSARARRWTSSVRVKFDPAAIGIDQIIRILERIEDPAAAPQAEPSPAPPRYALANASIGLAVAGELALPGLLPVSAALLVGSNLGTFREALAEVRARKLGLPLVSTAIVAVTLSSGQFVAAALMGWSYQFWKGRYRDSWQDARRRLPPGLVRCRRFARASSDGSSSEVAVESLRPGDRVDVHMHEVVPADGTVSVGSALVDERPVRGDAALARKGPGSAVLAGSRLVSGSITVVVDRPGPAGRAATLGRALVAGAGHATRAPADDSGEPLADRAVGPTLAVAGLGLLAGGPATAGAILRPDYATGPGMGAGLEALREVADSARAGVAVRDASAFRRFAEADALVLDDHPGLYRVGLEVARVLAVAAEDDVLRLALAAFGDLDDDRAPALRSAAEGRGLSPWILDPDALSFGPAPGVRFSHGGRVIVVAEVREGSPGGPLSVTRDGEPLGIVAFGRAAEPEAAAAIRALRERGFQGIGLLSSRPGSQVAADAASLGVDVYRGGMSTVQKAAWLRSCRDRGRKVAFVGDGRAAPEAARAAWVAASPSAELDPGDDPSSILLLRPGLDALVGLRDRSRQHVDRLRAVQGAALIPNLACVAGAFTLGFTSLSSVILTNLGTLGIYAQSRDRPARGRRPRRLRVG